ncbi:MAG: hypothetical protein CSA36_08125, partial [Draconibacterium sp.]
MILSVLKTNRPVNLILFPLAAILLWFKNLLKPAAYPFYPGENSNLLFLPIYRLTLNTPWLQVALSLLLVIIAAFLIQQLNDRFSLNQTRTKLPAFIYVLFLGGFIQIHTLHPILFATIFFVFSLHSLLAIFANPEPFNALFNAGFFIALGALFYFELVFFLPAFLIGIVILRRNIKWRDYAVIFIGFLVPFILALGFAFLTDHLSELLFTFEKNIVTPTNHLQENPVLLVYIASLALLIVFGSLQLIRYYAVQKIGIRKFYLFFLIIFVFAVAVFFLIPAVSQEILVIAL